MGNEVNVVQLTNHTTQKVNKIDSVKRYNLPDQIMLARLKAYSKFDTETQYTFFCDADSLFINKLFFPEDTLENILLAPRQQDFIMNRFNTIRSNRYLNDRMGCIGSKEDIITHLNQGPAQNLIQTFFNYKRYSKLFFI